MAVKKDEKTGTWYFYGSYKMKNGKCRQYKKRGFPKKKDAVKAEIIFKENVKDPYKNITLEELFNIYAAYTEKRIKESTYKVQNRLLERWIDILGDVNIKSITTNDIEVAMELMINNVGYETAKNYLSRINKMLRFAVRKGYLESNPCSPIELAKNPNEKKIEMKYWTLEQFNLFIPYVENPLYHLLFNNQFYMGMRIGDDDDKIRLNQRKPSKYKGLRRFGPEKNLQRINKFMKERPIFYKNLIQMKENIRFYLRCFYCITKVMILQFNSENRTELARNG